jgi:hypothetical protein
VFHEYDDGTSRITGSKFSVFIIPTDDRDVASVILYVNTIVALIILLFVS